MGSRVRYQSEGLREEHRIIGEVRLVHRLARSLGPTRNSIPIMSATPITLSGLANQGVSYDFRTSQSQAWGTNPMIQVDDSPVYFAMRGADGDLSQDISAFDFLNVWLPQNGGSAGYDQGDFNLDGSVTAFDFLNVWLQITDRRARYLSRRQGIYHVYFAATIGAGECFSRNNR